MAQPESGLTEEQRRRKRQLELRRKRAAAEQQKNEQNRIAARSARSGQTPDFNRPVDPAKQQGFINTALTNPLDRFQNEIKNFEPRPDAGINHPMDALLFKFGNSLTGGAFQAAGNDVAPGAELGNRAVKASDSYPVAAMTGQTGGMATQVIAGGHALAPLKGLPLVKNAVDAAGKTRLGSYAGRMAKDMGLWTGESALQGATTLASENAAYTGKEPTMGDRAAMAKDMATMNMGDLGVQMPFVKDIPLNVAGPLGTSLMRRTGTALATQGASVTPQHVRKSVQSGTGRLSGGPEQMRAVAGVIDTELAGGLRPQSIAAVHRILKHSGLTDSDIRALNTEVSERMQALPGSAASRKTVGQLYSEILEETKPQAAENIRAVLRERRLNIRRNDNSAGIIRAGTRDLRDSQKDFLDNSATTNLGTDTRIGVREQVKAAKKEIGDEYDRILDAAPVTGEGADSLRFTLKSDPRSATVLKRKAKNAGFVKRGKDGKLTVDVNAYIDANPYRAGHWMRSRLSKDARSAQGTEKGDLLDTVEEIDEVLNGFDAYAQTKSNWGSEQGVMDARTFGDKLFGGTDSKQINNDGMRAELVESFNALPEREKTVALASIRDAALARMRGGPADQQARISSITTGGAIDFFNEVGAKNFADDLLAIKQEQGYLNAFDPDAGPRTAPNQQAVSQAPALYNSKIANAVDNSTPGTVLGEGALMAFAPHYQGLYAAYRGSRLLAEMGLGTRAKTLEDMTRFLMARPQASGNLPMKNVTPTKGGSTAPPAGGSPMPMKPPPNSGTPGPDFPIVVRHDDGQEIGFKTRAEAEAFARENPAGSPLPMKGDAKHGGSTTTDRAVDAAALGVASGGFVGPADAEGVNYEAEFASVEQDLQRAQGERQATLQRLQAAQDELAAWNARFNAEDRDVKAIQTFLRDNVNPDLAVDGDPRGQTATANQQYISRLEQAIIAQQEALAKNDEMVQSAEKRRADLENRQVYDQTAPNPAWDFVREKLPWVGAAAGIYAGYRTRGGTMRKARQKAEAVENQVEGLLKPSRGKNALSKDSHAVNEMHELGGSGPNVPFDDYLTGPKQGQPRARPNAAEIASLFPKASQNWSRADIAGSALWGLEGTAGTVGMMYSDANLQAAETRLRQLEDAPEKDLAAIKKARSDVEFWKSAKAISQASQMLGIYGAGINLAKGAVEKLPTPQPNKKKIADMRSSVAQRIQKRDEEYRHGNR